jgi:branched-chain amino acid transport system substrate-binding protein
LPKRSWASAALALIAVLVGCGGGGDGDPSLTVYVSLPPSGDGRDAADGARMAFEEAGGEVGGTAIAAEYLDAWGAPGRWTPVQAAANARTAIQDSTAIAYLGDFESGATRASLPVTNEARLLQVSPASAAENLIDEDAEERTFGRVIPSDEEQAEAGAGWARELGFDKARAESDGSEYGDLMAREFVDAAGYAVHLRGTGRLLYYAGLPRARPPDSTSSRTVMVTDAGLASGITGLATSAAVDPSQLPPAGRDFAERFEGEYGRRPGRYAAYGYEAMAVILDSIERASDPLDRASVVDAFFDIADRESILGTYSIDEEGNTTLDRMIAYELRAGAEPEPAAVIGAP